MQSSWLPLLIKAVLIPGVLAVGAIWVGNWGYLRTLIFFASSEIGVHWIKPLAHRFLLEPVADFAAAAFMPPAVYCVMVQLGALRFEEFPVLIGVYILCIAMHYAGSIFWEWLFLIAHGAEENRENTSLIRIAKGEQFVPKRTDRKEN